MHHIHIAAAVLLRADGALLTVRKRGSSFFMLAGGKIDQGEDGRTALLRELEEELQIRPVADDLHALGSHSAVAANEPDSLVHAELFLLRWQDGDITAANEIEETRWISANEADTVKLAPLLRDSVTPIWRDLLTKTDALLYEKPLPHDSQH